MAEELASVPEESTIGFTAIYPTRNIYRDWIRTVSVSGGHIIQILFSQSGHSGSSYSSNSGASSYLSNNSGCSSGSSAGAKDFINANELTRIACQMVTDGYTQRVVQTFDNGGDPERALENWFFELDVDWVLQIGDEHGLWRQIQLRDMVKRWIRALILIVSNIKELVVAVHKMPEVARFGKASISAMIVFINAIVPAFKVENLQSVVHMYICISSASCDLSKMHLISLEARSILNEIRGSLDTEGDRLIGTMSNMMKEMRETLVDDVDSWAIEILRGRGAVHRNIRSLVDCLVSMRKAQALTQNSAQSHNTRKLCDLIDDTIRDLNALIWRKSELCSDPSLRYLFLLNNSNFIAQVSEPSILLDADLWSGHHRGLKLIPECEKYMDSYLDVSWGHVLSCISKPKSPGPLCLWINSSPLEKFESAFRKTYETQKFWKVPDPRLRSLLRGTITKRVISGYQDYLKGHPGLEKHTSSGNSSPGSFEEMLGELFEG